MYFLLPTCANYTAIDPDMDYSTDHIHPVYHMMFVTNGMGCVQCGDQTYSLKEQDIVVVPPNQKHIFASESRLGMTYFSFNFYLIPLEAYQRLSMEGMWYTQANYSNINPYAETLPLHEVFELTMQDIFVRYQESNWPHIMEAVFHFSKTSVQFFENLVPQMFCHPSEFINSFCSESAKLLWDLCNWMKSPDTQEDDLQKDLLLRSIFAFLEENVYEKYSLSKMAEQLNYSSGYLCSYFSQKTGITINDYFNRLKVFRACNYLRTTTKSVTEISEILNFSSPNHFSKNFSKVKGVSPKYYRQHLEIV